ncbi:MAG: RNA polymerase sigma factor [Chloroflexi bacterium]|nr:RNA polymerase sigma factor [Chloroflexota bacterium]MBV9899457.1 RNA polymerase sigma factor [Chloroflexota bacterium]
MLEPKTSYALLERVFRQEAGRLTASLVRYLGDFDLAEELMSEALVEALERWETEGAPERPAAWLLTTARRKGLDRLRRDARYRDKLKLLAALPETAEAEPDDRLRLIFTCCHPSLARDAQIPLTLRAVVGLTTEEIARAFMVPEPTLAKRIVRAKHKIVASGVTYRVPAFEELGSRLDDVLTVIYLVFNEGYVATSGGSPIRRDLARDAEWLAGLLVNLLPDEPEPQGLLALIRLHLARWQARVDANGDFVLLEHQDRSLWDRKQIADALHLLARAAAHGRPGRYQLEAAIAGAHCEAPTWAATNWQQILDFYTLLMQFDDSPVVALNRAIPTRHVHGAVRALEEVDRLTESLAGYHLFHATRAALLKDLGRHAEAAEADARALELTRNPAERTLLERRLRLA